MKIVNTFDIVVPFAKPTIGSQSSTENEKCVDGEGEIGDPLIPEIIDHLAFEVLQRNESIGVG